MVARGGDEGIVSYNNTGEFFGVWEFLYMLVWVAIWLSLNHNLELSDKKYAFLTRQIMS